MPGIPLIDRTDQRPVQLLKEAVRPDVLMTFCYQSDGLVVMEKNLLRRRH